MDTQEMRDRITRLEAEGASMKAEISKQEALLNDISRKQDRIINELSKYKGMAGAVAMAFSILFSMAIIFKDHVAALFKG